MSGIGGGILCSSPLPIGDGLSDDGRQGICYVLDEESGILAASVAETTPKAEVMECLSDDTEDDYVDASKDSPDGNCSLEELASMKRNRRKPHNPRRLDSQASIERQRSTSVEDARRAPGSAASQDAQHRQIRGRLRVGVRGAAAEKVPCTVCSRPFASRYMNSHMRIHRVDDTTSDPVRTSPRRSRRQASLRALQIDEQADEVKAEDGAGDGSNLSEEELRPGRRRPHHADSSAKLYECYVCDRSFSKSAMPAHMLTHEASVSKKKKSEEAKDHVDQDLDVKPNLSGEDDSEVDDEECDGRRVTRRKLKKFPCDICGKSFDRYYLLEHMRSHARRMSLALAKSNKTQHQKLKNAKKFKVATNISPVAKKDEPVVNNDLSSSGDDDKTSSSAADAADGEDADDTDAKDKDESDDGGIKKKKLNMNSVMKRSRRQRPKLPCNVCGSLFNKYYMVIHLRSHTGEKPFTCSVCEKQFVSANSLSSHTNNCHGEQRGKVQCDICGRLVSSKMSLRQHLRTHSEEKPYQCHVCGKSFKQCAQLSAHVKTHSDGMPYQCEACGHRYKSVTGLIRHREYHHLGIRRKYPCELCGKSFTRHSKLRDHLMWHRGTSPYVCKYCGKRLLSRKTLNTHLLIHEDLKPYKCETCGKSFRQNCVLKRHLTVHTGIKPFHCDLCGKQFIHRVYLAKHICDVQHDGSRTFVVL